MRYPKTPNDDRYVIETQHGCYSESGWCYCSTRKTLQGAKSFVGKWGDEYRIWDAKEDKQVENRFPKAELRPSSQIGRKIIQGCAHKSGIGICADCEKEVDRF
ncbi:hypothetical protein N9913_02435 [Porticoccaceae bacterium]|nr:hypothetical protein [Porticoccaceae bacterium]